MFRKPLKSGTLAIAAAAAIVASCKSSPPQDRTALDTLTSDHLIALLNLDSVAYRQGLGDTSDIRDAARHELIRRKPYDALFRAFVAPEGFPFEKTWLARIIDSIRTPVTDSAMATLVSEDTTLTAYYAVRYAAEVGDSVALARLARNFWKYGLNSFELEDLIPIFARYRYGPAAPRLVEAMNALNMTVVGDAEEALRAIYPEVDSTPPEYMQAVAFWESYVARHPKN